MAGRKTKIYLNSTEFQPRQEFILVEPIELEKEEKTESGIVIAINANSSIIDRPSTGVIIALGSKIEDLEVGDTVIWPDTDGIDFEFRDGNFVLLREVSVIGTKK